MCEFLMIRFDFLGNQLPQPSTNILSKSFNGKCFLIIVLLAHFRHHSCRKMGALHKSCLSKMELTLTFRNVYIFKGTCLL